MARTESNQELPLGADCPAFELVNVIDERAVGRDDVFGGVDDADGRKGLLVAFVCVHCPFVKHMEQAFAALAAEYADRIAFVAISSNDVDEYPEDAPEHMREQAARLGWKFPYLVDESQETAKVFHAACTPDLYLFDREFNLVYHGQFDETRPYRQSDAAAGVVKDERIHQAAHGGDLRRALGALLAGEPPLQDQRPGLGCNIKWRD
ncbi:thioredoxin family protein [Terriglobus aquaticus]|uniref:Thioredoxin family protein n=1 Tax=Terriglobus aquaticus TaxID=940139 RepID=A0ABW9KN01_9BACT|nr:thioredoxin family protein [Terriglobus aquaticus]